MRHEQFEGEGEGEGEECAGADDCACTRSVRSARRIGFGDLREDRCAVLVEEPVETFDLGGVHDVDHVRPPRIAADRVGQIVTMVGVEPNREPGEGGLPLGSLTDRSMSDVAQRTVPAAEVGTDPANDLAAQGAVGVVKADEARDPLGRCCGARTHRDSIADLAPIAAAAWAEHSASHSSSATHSRQPRAGAAMQPSLAVGRIRLGAMTMTRSSAKVVGSLRQYPAKSAARATMNRRGAARSTRRPPRRA